MKNSIRGLLCLITILISTHLIADEKWYRVEVLVFETNDKEALSQPFPQASKPTFTNVIDFAQMPNEKFKLLTDGKFTLAQAKAKIQKRYRLIAHKGWLQTLETKNEALGVLLHQGDLEGIVRLSGGKYLHIDTDLLLSKAVSSDPSLPATLQSFRLKDSSRVRINELHYIDHPLYGMIVTVTPEKS